MSCWQVSWRMPFERIRYLCICSRSGSAGGRLRCDVSSTWRCRGAFDWAAHGFPRTAPEPPSGTHRPTGNRHNGRTCVRRPQRRGSSVGSWLVPNGCRRNSDGTIPQSPHWYLYYLGARPGRQNAGIGTALLRPMLETCDNEGLPAYLEATSPRNRALYRRHGFLDGEPLGLPDGGPPMYPMWRRPG